MRIVDHKHIPLGKLLHNVCGEIHEQELDIRIAVCKNGSPSGHRLCGVPRLL